MKDKENSLQASNISAPIPGKIIKILVSVGDIVNENTVVAVIESMKMEHMISITRKAKINSIHFKEGDFVNAKVTLITLE